MSGRRLWGALASAASSPAALSLELGRDWRREDRPGDRRDRALAGGVEFVNEDRSEDQQAEDESRIAGSDVLAAGSTGEPGLLLSAASVSAGKAMPRPVPHAARARITQLNWR
jgi:hypothetical protein